MPIELSTLFFSFLALGLVSVLGLWFYYDMRDRHAYSSARQRTVFHCVRCAHIYEQAGGAEQAACPACQYVNQRLKF